MKSDKIKKGIERVGARALLYATGISKDDMAKPFIAVATSRTDIIPGHIHMARLERFIERGIAAGGGVPFFFGVPGIRDGIAMGRRVATGVCSLGGSGAILTIVGPGACTVSVVGGLPIPNGMALGFTR